MEYAGEEERDMVTEKCGGEREGDREANKLEEDGTLSVPFVV